MITIFAEPITKNYFTQTCTLTNLLYIFYLLFILIFPFLAAFASERFWIRSTTNYENPIVQFKNEYQLFVLKNNETYFYSTIEDLNKYYPRKLKLPSTTYIIKDDNFDGIAEQIKMIISIPREDDSEIFQNFKLALFFDYGFNVIVFN